MHNYWAFVLIDCPWALFLPNGRAAAGWASAVQHASRFEGNAMAAVSDGELSELTPIARGDDLAAIRVIMALLPMEAMEWLLDSLSMIPTNPHHSILRLFERRTAQDPSLPCRCVGETIGKGRVSLVSDIDICVLLNYIYSCYALALMRWAKQWATQMNDAISIIIILYLKAFCAPAKIVCFLHFSAKGLYTELCRMIALFTLKRSSRWLYRAALRSVSFEQPSHMTASKSSHRIWLGSDSTWMWLDASTSLFKEKQW